MQIEDYLQSFEKYKSDVESFAQAVKADEKKARIQEIDRLSMEDADFWNKKESKTLMREQSNLKKYIEDWEDLTSKVSDVEVYLELYREGEEGLASEIVDAIETLGKAADEFELKIILSGENDANSAILTIHSGAGGTESCDWANMLYRMYLRFAEIRGYKADILDLIEGEEAGIKSATINVIGPYAYGYLKGETGVHRLVRISPFDSANRRHTSFASVFVLPEIDDEIEIDINESDLQTDTFRAGGAGGQHVNTTDSAVRITHLPTGIIAACQNERSQHKNKASAMKILKARLYEHELEKRNKEKEELENTKSEIGWGSQIRSYVMHPYKMVKDVRTRHETGNVDAVMDGGLDAFIRAYLLHTAGIDNDDANKNS